MNTSERAAAQVTARILRSIRKLRGINQTELAAVLEVSQSAISKFEAGQLILSAPQWYAFCEFSKIPADLTWRLGRVDLGLEYGLGNEPDIGWFKLPVQYKRNRGSRVRSLDPLIQFARKRLGDQEFEDWVLSHRMDPDYFEIMDLPIHLNFSVDLLKELIKRDLINSDALAELGAHFAQPAFHGALLGHFEGKETAASILRTYFAHQSAYDVNFEYQAEFSTGDSNATLQIRPAEFIKGTSYRDESLGDVICQIRKQQLIHLADSKGRKVSIKEHECHFKGHRRCVYELGLS